MAHEHVIGELAEGMRKIHGDLHEVILLDGSKYISLLSFSDGTVLPTFYYDQGDRFWQVVAYAVNEYPYLDEAAAKIGGTDPLSLLTFGYSGTGSQCFSAFVGRFGFVKRDFENMVAPLRVAKDGRVVGGTPGEDGRIEWEDGSPTPEARIVKKRGLLGKRSYVPDSGIAA
jgi:hypothetical protein